jgi:hypothetical protein
VLCAPCENGGDDFADKFGHVLRRHSDSCCQLQKLPHYLCSHFVEFTVITCSSMLEIRGEAIVGVFRHREFFCIYVRGNGIKLPQSVLQICLHVCEFPQFL